MTEFDGNNTMTERAQNTASTVPDAVVSGQTVQHDLKTLPVSADVTPEKAPPNDPVEQTQRESALRQLDMNLLSAYADLTQKTVDYQSSRVVWNIGGSLAGAAAGAAWRDSRKNKYSELAEKSAEIIDQNFKKSVGNSSAEKTSMQNLIHDLGDLSHLNEDTTPEFLTRVNKVFDEHIRPALEKIDVKDESSMQSAKQYFSVKLHQRAFRSPKNFSYPIKALWEHQVRDPIPEESFSLKFVDKHLRRAVREYMENTPAFIEVLREDPQVAAALKVIRKFNVTDFGEHDSASQHAFSDITGSAGIDVPLPDSFSAEEKTGIMNAIKEVREDLSTEGGTFGLCNQDEALAKFRVKALSVLSDPHASSAGGTESAESLVLSKIEVAESVMAQRFSSENLLYEASKKVNAAILFLNERFIDARKGIFNLINDADVKAEMRPGFNRPPKIISSATQEKVDALRNCFVTNVLEMNVQERISTVSAFKTLLGGRYEDCMQTVSSGSQRLVHDMAKSIEEKHSILGVGTGGGALKILMTGVAGVVVGGIAYSATHNKDRQEIKESKKHIHQMNRLVQANGRDGVDMEQLPGNSFSERVAKGHDWENDTSPNGNGRG